MTNGTLAQQRKQYLGVNAKIGGSVLVESDSVVKRFSPGAVRLYSALRTQEGLCGRDLYLLERRAPLEALEDLDLARERGNRRRC